MPLSVLSALARLDIDPWQEAAELARLPPETATQRFASLIAALPDAWLAHLEFGTIAARLVALLPRQPVSGSSSAEALPNVAVEPADVTKLHAGVYMYIVLILFMLGAQWIAANHETPGRTDKTQAPAARSVSPLSSGQ